MQGSALVVSVNVISTVENHGLSHDNGDSNLGPWLGVGPDDSPVLLKHTGTQDIYSLDREAS